MPLLMCPNDDNPMQTVERAGVQFDMCPRCRGVWLDRGELEKLMAVGRDDAVDGGDRRPPPVYAPQPQPYRGDDYRRDDDYRRGGHDPKYHHKKKRGFDLFDIFD